MTRRPSQQCNNTPPPALVPSLVYTRARFVLFSSASLPVTLRPQIECFEDNPGILMYGNMCVVYTTGIWLLLASYLELPVSTTHSTIGGIVGMAMTYRGADCVVWYEEAEKFPFVDVSIRTPPA